MNWSKSLIILIISLLAVPLSFSAQDEEDFYVYGNVKDHFSRKKIAGVTVKVLQDGNNYESQTSSTNGKYEFFLPLDHHYEFIFEKAGLVSKRVEIDTRNIPEEDRRGGFSNNMDMSLFENIEGVDFSILQQPIGKGNYIPERGNIEFDFAYTSRIQAELNRLMKEVEDKKKDEEKAEDKEAQALAKLEADFEKLMKEGKDNMTKKSYEGAVNKFKGALELKPEDGGAKSSLAEAEKLLQEQLAAAEAEEKYKNAIDRGDDAFSAKNWQDAINAYNEALELKRGEKYPIDQIASAEKALADEKAKAADSEAVAKLISEGDAHVSKEEFDDGIDKFSEALRIIPDNKDAKSKLEDAKRLKSEWEANKAKREEFDALVKAADGFFDKEDYESAIGKYESALDVIDKDEYAEKRLRESKDLLEKQKKAAEEEAELAKKQAEFDKLIAAGDGEMGKEAFDSAIDNFEKALQIFPDDSTAKAKLADAEKAKADAQAAMETEEQYAALIKEADGKFDKEDYEAAIDSYTQAMELKNESYPKDRIEEARKIIEELKAKEEEERKQREAEMAAEELAKENQRRYDEFIAQGDDGMSSEDYEVAIERYEDALEVFVDDKKALDKLKKAQDARSKQLADLEEAERLKAEEEARNEAESEERKKRDQFDMHMQAGDDAFKANTFQPSIDSYKQALEIYPDDKTAQNKLERAMDALEKENQRLAEEEEKRRREEELEAQRAAEQAKLDEQRSEQDAKEKLDAQYNEFIRQADSYFADKDYRVAKVNYEEANNLKPDEPYPISRLERIEKLMAQQEEEERLRAERELKEREEKEIKDYARGADLAQSDEERIDAEMEEARRKAQQEKWDAMQSDKDRWSEIHSEYSEREGGRIQDNLDYIDGVKQYTQETQARFDRELEDKARNMEGYKEGLGMQDREYVTNHDDRIEDSREKSLEKEGYLKRMRDDYYSNTETYAEHAEKVDVLQRSREKMVERGQQFQGNSQDLSADHKEAIKETHASYIDNAQDRLEDSHQEIEEHKQAIQEFQKDTSKERLIQTSESLERDKEREADFLKALDETAKERRSTARENLMSQETYASGKSPVDYAKNELVDKYPAGVTEETYEDNGKMVIRRIVIVGNKAIEYHKVVARSGTYYFKNGESITEHLWRIESDKVTE